MICAPIHNMVSKKCNTPFHMPPAASRTIRCTQSGCLSKYTITCVSTQSTTWEKARPHQTTQTQRLVGRNEEKVPLRVLQTTKNSGDCSTSTKGRHSKTWPRKYSAMKVLVANQKRPNKSLP